MRRVGYTCSPWRQPVRVTATLLAVAWGRVRRRESEVPRFVLAGVTVLMRVGCSASGVFGRGRIVCACECGRERAAWCPARLGVCAASGCEMWDLRFGLETGPGSRSRGCGPRGALVVRSCVQCIASFCAEISLPFKWEERIRAYAFGHTHAVVGYARGLFLQY